MTTTPDRNCRKVFERLSAYLDQELAPADCEAIRAHLADCPPCLDFLDSLKETILLCRGLQVPEQPRPLSAEARRQLADAFRRLYQGGAPTLPNELK